MFAAIYLAFGAIVGATVPNPVNGTLVLLFVWIIDVFFGPTLSASQSLLTRVLPTHFVSLWTVDLPRGHGGPGELAVSLLWTLVALAVAFGVVMHTSPWCGRSPSRPPVTRRGVSSQPVSAWAGTAGDVLPRCGSCSPSSQRCPSGCRTLSPLTAARR